MSRARSVSRVGIETTIAISSNGNVGFGSTLPNTKVDIVGNVNVSGVTTSTSFVGSGASLTSLNASNISSGIVSTTQLATGSANNTTYLRGDQTWSAITSGFSNMQVFTSPGTFTVPPTTTKVKVTVTGGGAQYTPNPGGGISNGTSAGTGIALINISGGTSVPITIGAVGSGPTVGGTSSFGTYVSATGGTPQGGFSGGSASFPLTAPNYVSTIAINGGGHGTSASLGVYTVGAASYWGTGTYGSGGTYYATAAGGIVVVEW